MDATHFAVDAIVVVAAFGFEDDHRIASDVVSHIVGHAIAVDSVARMSFDVGHRPMRQQMLRALVLMYAYECHMDPLSSN